MTWIPWFLDQILLAAKAEVDDDYIVCSLFKFEFNYKSIF
jgi:hypothetical protein